MTTIIRNAWLLTLSITLLIGCTGGPLVIPETPRQQYAAALESYTAATRLLAYEVEVGNISPDRAEALALRLKEARGGLKLARRILDGELPGEDADALAWLEETRRILGAVRRELAAREEGNT